MRDAGIVLPPLVTSTNRWKALLSLVAAILAVTLAPACGSSRDREALDGSTRHDAGGTDADALDAAPLDAWEPEGDAGAPQPVVVELVNTGSDAVQLDGSYNLDCGAPYYKLQDATGAEVLDRPPFLACRCSSCSSSACMGIADSGPAFLEIPAGGAVRVTWEGLRYASTEGCEAGCLAGTPAEDGPFTLVVRYRRGGLACPEGDEPMVADISPPDGDGQLFVCELSALVRCFAHTTALDQRVEATFRASEGTVRVELP